MAAKRHNHMNSDIKRLEIGKCKLIEFHSSEKVTSSSCTRLTKIIQLEVSLCA